MPAPVLPPCATVTRQDAPQGIAAAIAAFSIWGVLVLYWRVLAELPAYEQLCYRVVWSVVALLPLMFLRNRFAALLAALRQKKLIVGLVCSTVCIGANWYLYIWAVSQNRVLDASLGYYINPMVSALLGGLVLKERFSRLQGIGIALAGVGVLWSIVGHGALPVLALSVAISFSLYGLARKVVPVDPVCGVFVETLLMLPFALGVLWFAYDQGRPLPGVSLQCLLVLAGPLTLLPMLAFNYAAQRIRLTTLGLTQYMSPTLSFLIGVYVLHEPFNVRGLITFGCIWAGLAVFTWASWRMLHPLRH